MINMTLIMDSEGAWPELQGKAKLVTLMGDAAPAMQVGVLPHGMTSGRPSVTFRLDLPDGTTVLAETSARLFCGAARAIMAKYPDLFDGD